MYSYPTNKDKWNLDSYPKKQKQTTFWIHIQQIETYRIWIYIEQHRKMRDKQNLDSYLTTLKERQTKFWIHIQQTKIDKILIHI